MKLISYLIRCAIAALSLVPWYLVGILVGLVDKRNGLRIFVSWNRFFLRLFRIEVSVHNENDSTESLSGCVFTLLNQTSLLDSGIGGVSIPLPWRGIVNIEFTIIPFFGWAMWIFCWVIVRQWPKQAKRAMQQVKPFLQSGGNLWISIEGRRSKDGSLSRYKKGPVILAMQAQAKIVPVLIYGTRNCLPHGKWRISPGKVKIRFLEVIPTENMQYEDRDKLVNILRTLAEKELGQQSERRAI
jgi:1-acyl-sn-glycerol-3-phosphate acyltransferase